MLGLGEKVVSLAVAAALSRTWGATIEDFADAAYQGWLWLSAVVALIAFAVLALKATSTRRRMPPRIPARPRPRQASRPRVRRLSRSAPGR